MSPYAFVITWAIQAALLGLVALALPRLLRVRQPGMLESWWASSALGVVVLPILPLMMPARSTPAAPILASLADSTTVAFSAVPDAARLLSPLGWLAVVWTTGVLIRLGWLIAGQHRLRRLAENGAPIVDDPALARARVLAATHKPPMPLRKPVPVIATDDAGPCAFGWMRLQVLVPRSLSRLPEDQRVSVYLHELLHVVRFDVQRSYADECWRLVWWWQPAVWWMLARLRLTRELQVDRAVVASMGARRAYVEALLWCGVRGRTLALSSQVGGGRHMLVRRVALLIEEVEMSWKRRWATIGVLTIVFGTASAVLGMYSPLRAAQFRSIPDGGTQAGPLERVAVRPTLDAPAPRRIVAVEPAWNDASTGYRFRAHVVIDGAGRVAETRLVDWAGAARPVGQHVELARAAALDAVRQWQFESPTEAPMLIVTDVVVGPAGTTIVSDRDGNLLDKVTAAARAPLRVGGGIAPPGKILDVKPEYPQDAKDAKVQGVVIIECTLDAAGAVSEARVVRSIPLLDQAALAAVQQWRYTPTWLNGEPVPVIVTVTVNFTLQ